MFAKISRFVLGLVVVSLIFGVGTAVQAQNAPPPPPPPNVGGPAIADLQAQIAALLAQIAVLQDQLNPPVTTIPVTDPAPPAVGGAAGSADVLIVGGKIRLIGIRPGRSEESRLEIQIAHRGRFEIHHPLKTTGVYGEFIFAVPMISLDGQPIAFPGESFHMSVVWNDETGRGVARPGFGFDVPIPASSFEQAPGAAIVDIGTVHVGEVAWFRWVPGLNFLALPIVPAAPVFLGDVMNWTGSQFLIVVEEGRFRTYFAGSEAARVRTVRGFEGMIVVAQSDGEILVFGTPFPVERDGVLKGGVLGRAEFEIPKGLALSGLPFYPDAVNTYDARYLGSVIPGSCIVISPRWWDGTVESFVLPAETGPYLSPEYGSRAYLFVSPETKQVSYFGRSWSAAAELDASYGKAAPALTAGAAPELLPDAAELVGLLENEVRRARGFGPEKKCTTTWGALKRR